MGREVRMVPAGWEHPRDEHGHYKPLYNEDYITEGWRWVNESKLWAEGKHPDQDYRYEFYWDWSGGPPDEDTYRPKWADEACTHLQMYETTSEGTPISPVMETAEELARWLADTGASAFGDSTATYEQWLSTIKRGWAVSAIGVGGKLVSGVEGMEELKR